MQYQFGPGPLKADYDPMIQKLKNLVGIVEDTDIAQHAIANGQYVIWKGDLYVAKADISSGTTLSSSNLTAKTKGVGETITSLSSNLTATNNRTLAKRYYQAVTINTTNTTWSWGTGYIQLVGDLILYSSGISPKTATNDWLRVATVESSYKPTYEVRTVCVSEDGTSSRVIKIDTNGNIEIYKPEVKAYWFTLVWLRDISN